MDGCTDTLTGPLETPCAVAVIVAVPATGLPSGSVSLQTTKSESQTPPHTRPAGDMVAILVFDELKVNVVFTGLLEAFTAAALMVTTSPATREIVAGITVTDATVFLLEEELPPQPATNDKNRTPRAMDAAVPAKCRRPSLFPRVLESN